ncbi:MAG: hypothetical protein AMXMBFR59_40490 [Rhodanobacteraceae bacterium]
MVDRQRRGFSALLVSLLEHKYSNDPPRNSFGDAPFLVPGDFSRCNPAYFDHAAWVIDQAAKHGQLVLLAVSYIGCCGDDGWYAEMVSSGYENLRGYGRFLATRFSHLKNIVWVHGGDGNPADPAVVREIALGIREVDLTGLHTAHTAPGYQALDVYGDPPWLDVNNIYTYDPVRPIALRAYGRPDARPFFLLESEYEGENRRAPLVRIRSQAWQSVLSGAMGQVFGNNPIWHFASTRPITPFRSGWQDALGSEGARSMSQLRRLFAQLSWWELTPSIDDGFLMGWPYTGHYDAVAAYATSGNFAVVYVPQPRQVRLDLRRGAMGVTRMRWYDPVSGLFDAATALQMPRDLLLRVIPPRWVNAGGDRDWVLVLDSAS